MEAISCLSAERTLTGASASSKKKVFDILSKLLSKGCPELSEHDILESLFVRERLGCTGLGFGVAIPHGRVNGCQKIIAALILLDSGIEYESPDQLPVDIFLALLVPEEAHKDHLECLSRFAKLLNNDGFRRQLRNAYSNQALYDIVKAALEKSIDN